MKIERKNFKHHRLQPHCCLRKRVPTILVTTIYSWKIANRKETNSMVASQIRKSEKWRFRPSSSTSDLNIARWVPSEPLNQTLRELSNVVELNNLRLNSSNLCYASLAAPSITYLAWYKPLKPFAWVRPSHNNALMKLRQIITLKSHEDPIRMANQLVKFKMDQELPHRMHLRRLILS